MTTKAIVDSKRMTARGWASRLAVLGSIAIGWLFLVPAATATSAILLPACSDEDCKPKKCDDLVNDSSLKSNGKSYERCGSCTSSGVCSVTLKDDSGNVFYECDDGEGKDCTKGSVDAQFAFCDVG
jgi:hypothetical protein